MSGSTTEITGQTISKATQSANSEAASRIKRRSSNGRQPRTTSPPKRSANPRRAVQQIALRAQRRPVGDMAAAVTRPTHVPILTPARLRGHQTIAGEPVAIRAEFRRANHPRTLGRQHQIPDRSGARGLVDFIGKAARRVVHPRPRRRPATGDSTRVGHEHSVARASARPYRSFTAAWGRVGSMVAARNTHTGRERVSRGGLAG
jgi:hypothetical protein